MSRFKVTGGYIELEGIEGAHPDHDLPSAGPGKPAIPGTLPAPPEVSPPPTAENPIVPVEPGTLPGTIWPSDGLPTGIIDNSLPSKTYWFLVGIPGVGWRYIAVDLSLKADTGPVTPPPPHVDGQPVEPPPEAAHQPVEPPRVASPHPTVPPAAAKPK